ncbi:hypothetical protein LZG04_06525 [Saccharothrix sp. S26]|uniref:hypothetical protein n=1 Tax=Saccharothrix sp. S26 TaxID=2907215 RepID=UPI001F2D575F|nr:hypothetical protein [Saccharothrix sp. S26]MCE6994463.1 hypothetical protein [Saccharothrix sp. S26]
MAYEWIGTALVGLAGIYGTFRTGAQQRRTSKEVAVLQDQNKSDLELEKEKRQTYSRLLGKIERATAFATSDRLARRAIRENATIKGKKLDDVIAQHIADSIPKELTGTPAENFTKQVTAIVNAELEKEMKEFTEARRRELLTKVGFTNLDNATHIALEDLFTGVAEAGFLSEGRLHRPAMDVTLALMHYVASPDDDEEERRFKELQSRITVLRQRMQVDLNSVSL